MAVICPTVTATDLHQFREQMERVSAFAGRVHIDLMDGHLAPTVSPPIDHIWWPDNIVADLHVMYKWPLEHLSTLLHLRPNLVIVQAEAEGNFLHLARALHQEGIRAGVSLLPQTEPSIVEQALGYIDHVLIFSGDLGKYGGHADLNLLRKVDYIRNKQRGIEIGWDGGINQENAPKLIEGGVDVLNVGGSIQNANDPSNMYSVLKAIAEQQTSIKVRNST